MHIGAGLKAIDEWELFHTIKNEGNYSDLTSQMAKAIGPTFMKMVLRREKKSVVFYRSKKETFHFKCKETESNTPLTISVLETDNSNNIIISYRSLQPMLQKKGISLKIRETGSHYTLSKTQNIFDYFTRLVSGQICGLLCQSEEDPRFTIQLSEKPTRN